MDLKVHEAMWLMGVGFKRRRGTLARTMSMFFFGGEGGE
jgi:hypothetical protein